MKFHAIKKKSWKRNTWLFLLISLKSNDIWKEQWGKGKYFAKSVRVCPFSGWRVPFAVRKLCTVTIPFTSLHEYSVLQVAKPPTNNCTYLLSLFWNTPKALKQKYIARMKIPVSLNASAKCNWADTYSIYPEYKF